MARLLSTIIETRIKDNEKPREVIRRVNNLLLDLVFNKNNKAYFLNGNRISIVEVEGLWGEIDDPCRVPDFNHNGECKCEHPEPNGVLRLFKADVIVDGYPELKDVIGIWELDKDTHLIVTGITCGVVNIEKRIDLKKIGD